MPRGDQLGHADLRFLQIEPNDESTAISLKAQALAKQQASDKMPSKAAEVAAAD